MRETIIAQVKRVFPGTLAGYSARHRFIVTAKAYHLDGNTHPHFSVTGEVPNLRGTDIERGGCMHDEILKAWPAIKPIVDLHLSNADDGQPMYAEANGWYWMAGALGGAGEKYHGGNSDPKRTADECLAILASHLRISLDEAKSLRDKCTENRAVFAEYVAAQANRWKAEAGAGLALIRTLATQQQTDLPAS